MVGVMSEHTVFKKKADTWLVTWKNAHCTNYLSNKNQDCIYILLVPWEFHRMWFDIKQSSPNISEVTPLPYLPIFVSFKNNQYQFVLLKFLDVSVAFQWIVVDLPGSSILEENDVRSSSH